MAKIIMTSSEPIKLIQLIESMFPGVNLDAIESLLKDTTLAGNLSISRKLNAETVQLDIEIK